MSPERERKRWFHSAVRQLHVAARWLWSGCVRPWASSFISGMIGVVVGACITAAFDSCRQKAEFDYQERSTLSSEFPRVYGKLAECRSRIIDLVNGDGRYLVTTAPEEISARDLVTMMQLLNGEVTNCEIALRTSETMLSNANVLRHEDTLDDMEKSLLSVKEQLLGLLRDYRTASSQGVDANLMMEKPLMAFSDSWLNGSDKLDELVRMRCRH